MTRANKRDTEIRTAIETIGACLAVIRTPMPINQLRVEQATERFPLEQLLSPVQSWMMQTDQSMDEIERQITAALRLLKE